MITLSILCIVWGIVSYFRIKKICKQTGVEFNPFEGSFVDCLGFYMGLVILISTIIILTIRYLP